jgi:hypothetical protein
MYNVTEVTKIGITGTRDGMNKIQRELVTEFLKTYRDPSSIEFHHGDCIGVDVEAAQIAKDLGFKIICHPPEKQEMRGFFDSDETRHPYGYLKRDRNIVDETQLLLVVPKQDSWQSKGGTWYTASHAKKTKKPYIIFYPRSNVV